MISDRTIGQGGRPLESPTLFRTLMDVWDYQMRYTVATAILLFGLLGFLECGYPDTSNWSKEKTINAIEKGWSWEVRVVAIRRVSSDWDLAIEQQKRLINVLAQALKDEGPNDRWNAVEALGQIGPEARATVPALAQALKSEDSGVRQCSERA